MTVSGDLSVRDIPGHEYFVSKYASIQAAIDAAYNNGSGAGRRDGDRRPDVALHAGRGSSCATR